ncbi:MAG: hypothetical protein ACYCW6_02250 [Candidatus Xenobia bacterium]
MQIGRFSLRGDRTLFLFTFADAAPRLPDDLAVQKAQLRERFGADGWELPAILQALDLADRLYFDRVSQIRVTKWTRAASRRSVTPPPVLPSCRVTWVAQPVNWSISG